MKLNGWWNWNHLRDAETANGGEKSHWLRRYITHMFIGLREASVQLFLFFASVIHAFIPPAFNFILLEIVVKQAIGLHRFLPKHPAWKKLKEELNDKQE